jgi:hypothetical protein
MKVKVYVIDLETPAKVKRWGLRVGIPLGLLLGGGAIAWAAGLHTWNQRDTLNASDLNGNFSALQSAIPMVTAWQSYAPTVTASGTDVTTTMGTLGVWRRGRRLGRSGHDCEPYRLPGIRHSAVLTPREHNSRLQQDTAP